MSSLYMDEIYFFLHGLYGGFFSQGFCPILSKINGVSIFVSIPDYYYPSYSTLLQVKPCSIKKEYNRVEYSSQ